MKIMYKIVLFIFFLLITSTISYAQVFTPVSDSVISLEFNSIQGKNFYWFDYDNDNDFDLFVLKHNTNGVYGVFYKNLPGYIFVAYDSIKFRNLAVLRNIMDFDNDGDIDIICDDTIYRNDYSQTASFTKLSDSCYYDPIGSHLLSWQEILNKGRYGTFKSFNNQTAYFLSNEPTSCGYTQFATMTLGHPTDLNNDGYIDLMGNTILSKNNGIGYTPRFTISNAGIYFYQWNSFQIVDIDNDGFSDVSASGSNISYFDNSLYANNHNFTFSKISFSGIPDSLNTFQYLFDYNNDGNQDILISKSNGNNALYKSNGSFSFIEDQTIQNLNNNFTTASAVDYDNDGDLDLFLSGSLPYWPGQFTTLYRNDSTPPNTPPTAPITMWTTMDSTKVVFHWHRATDVETPQITLSYNLMIGTSPKSINITSPMADTVTGFRRVVELGNAQLNNFYILDKSIFNIGDTVYWSVQTIDNGFGYSPFSQESSAIIYDRMEAPVFDTICGNDSVLWRANYYKTTGRHKDSYGLDSAFFLDLKVHPSYLDQQTADICSGSSYSWNGNTYYNSGAYNIQHYTTEGCDSIERLVLNVHPGLTVLQNKDLCMGDSLLFGGTYLKSSGIYWDSLRSVYNCDSIIQLTLNIAPSDTTVWQSGDTLFATPQNASFRWWNCDKQQYIYAANQSYFVPYQNGHYAAEISANSCSYLTQCYEITGLAIDDTGIPDLEINLMPNPNKGQFFLELKAAGKQEYQIQIFDALGKKIYNQSIEFENYKKLEIDLKQQPSGVYQLRIISKDDVISRRFIIR